MIGNLEAAEHRDLGPVLVASYMMVSGTIQAIVYTAQGLVKMVSIEDLSILWHYDPLKGWEPDFLVAETDT